METAVATILDDGGRERRGRKLALRLQGRFKRDGRRWLVPSSNPNIAEKYIVDPIDSTCTCPDFELSQAKCKHQHAVEYVVLWQQTDDGTEAPTAVARSTYSQDWPAYNRAQVREQEHVEEILAGLCDGIQQPERAKGRPRLLQRDLIFNAVMKVYGGMSGRRAQTDLRNCRSRGTTTTSPSYNSIFRVFESPALTSILKTLIVEAAQPLIDLERQFAIDATGFSTSTYGHWHDDKWGSEPKRKRHDFVKLHALVGTNTNVVVAADVNDAADCPMLKPLLDATVEAGFKVDELSADKAYLSKLNADAIKAAGATAYIPFKANSTGAGPKLWRQMFAFFSLNRPEFLAHYHRRSNVETSFSMIKKKFGPAVRSRLPVAQANEVLAKVLCHNLCCLVSCFYESGLKPYFWKSSAAPTAPTLRLVQS